MSHAVVVEALQDMGFVKPERQTATYESLNGISKNVMVFHSETFGGKLVVMLLKGVLEDYPILVTLVEQKQLKHTHTNREGQAYYREP